MTPAIRARTLGWQALGLWGGSDATDQVVDRIVELAHRLDEHLSAKRGRAEGSA